MKKLNKLKSILVSIGLIITTILCIFNINTHNKSKNFIIRNKDKIKHVENCDFSYYVIDSLQGYYTDITIKLEDDSKYTVIFWGDRESWLWNYKLDYYFTEDLIYNKYNNKDISKDVEIINILKNIK